MKILGIKGKRYITYENNKFRSYRKDQQGNEYWRCTINGCTARLKTSNGSEVVDLRRVANPRPVTTIKTGRVRMRL